jgi:hypothetical protein
MCRSAKPGAFPTREELVAAGRSDLAAAVASSGGWLSLGWSSTAAEGPATTAAPCSSGGGHPDYPPETGVYYRGDLAPVSVEDSEWWVTRNLGLLCAPLCPSMSSRDASQFALQGGRRRGCLTIWAGVGNRGGQVGAW